MRRAYRTERDKRRALYIGATLATALIAALAAMGADNGRALERCSLSHSFDTCAAAIR